MEKGLHSRQAQCKRKDFTCGCLCLCLSINFYVYVCLPFDRPTFCLSTTLHIRHTPDRSTICIAPPSVLPHPLSPPLPPHPTIVFDSATAQCDDCGACALGHRLSRCSQCKAAFYCGRDCQRRSWKGGHKKTCVVGRS